LSIKEIRNSVESADTLNLMNTGYIISEDINDFDLEGKCSVIMTHVKSSQTPSNMTRSAKGSKKGNIL